MILLKITMTTDKQKQLMRPKNTKLPFMNKIPFQTCMERQFKFFFATINLSCLLSTWISFDLREKDASKTGERGFRRLP